MLKIAGIQMNCSLDKQRNMEKAQLLAMVAAEQGAKIICFQELFSTHWFPVDIHPENFQLAEEIPGPTTEAMRLVALKTQAVLILPFFEKGPEGLFFNTAVVLDADGAILGKYRKVHIPQLPLWEEKAYFQPGDWFPVLNTQYGRIGIQICWDNFFPEGTRILALKGAEVIFAPTAAALLASQDKWEKVICANAATNGVYIFRVNRVGEETRQHFYGKSFCATPEGALVDEPSGPNEGMVMATIDLKEIERTRRVWTFLRDRRPEVYGELISN